MPIIRAEHYPRQAIRRWLQDNGVRWHIREGEPIIVRGSHAPVNAIPLRVGKESATYGEKPWRPEAETLFDLYDRKRITFCVRHPLRNYLGG